MNSYRIAEVLEQKRQLHPELARPLSWESFRRVLARENIALFRVPITQAAKLMQWDGALGIAIDRRVKPPRDLRFGVHELAHAWLHVDRELVCVMNHSWPDSDDPREEEAEVLVHALLYGSRRPGY